VFEIGSSLREARLHGGIELTHVAAETHIRMGYLQALEEERFAVLPAPVYARAFLRTYAEYVGLDGERFVAEYNSRFPPVEPATEITTLELRQRRSRLSTVAVAGVAAVLLGLLGWALRPTPRRTNHHPPVAATRPRSEIRRARSAAPAPHARPNVRALLVLRAARGPCWLAVRRGDPRGLLLFTGILEPGQTRRFAAPKLWLRIGAPWNLDATLGGRPIRLPQAVVNVTMTPARMRLAAAQ
jgi:hypothetical protein